MTMDVNGNYGATPPIRRAQQEKTYKQEVKELAQAYEESIAAAEAERKYWNQLQYEGHQRIAALCADGKISERVAQVRGLMNDARAHAVYRQINAQRAQDEYRYEMLKYEHPEAFAS